MAQVVWTDEAKRWLQDIYDYIATDPGREWIFHQLGGPWKSVAGRQRLA